MSSATVDFISIPLKYDDQDTACHQVLVKENISKVVHKLKPAGRTLYVLNVPPYATPESLQKAFSVVGAVANVILQEKPSGDHDRNEQSINRFKVAYVIYENPSSMKKFLRLRRLNPLNADGQLLTGIDKWTKAYQERIPDPVSMQQEIDQYMASYDRQVSREQRAQEPKQDDEGWTTVTKSSANTFAQREATVSKLEDKMSNDRKQKELKNFYTFQIRESKKSDIVSLRKKFDRDLQKMQQIKKTKRFKPY
ncbi:ribosomal RNA-processing protein 7 homolog A [Armigeres subalbatus]|uniref:ribosomal RNA-processing protein 7 homolog A n=1 Tax=Armigeres subalbatus TaxID=124917 RepID=UPI002ED2BD65